MCHCLDQVVSERFPGDSITATGTVIFLRFYNPALGNLPLPLALHPAQLTSLGLCIHRPHASLLTSEGSSVFVGVSGTELSVGSREPAFGHLNNTRSVLCGCGCVGTCVGGARGQLLDI